jgi:nucleoside-diphosphate kinase
MIHPKQERTFMLIKPDGVKKGLIGEIIRRLEQRDLKVVALELIHATRAQINEHYPKDKAWLTRLGEKQLVTFEKYGYDPLDFAGTAEPLLVGKQIREHLVVFMTSGPMVKMVVEGVHAVDTVRKIVGKSLPYMAELGSIRGDFSSDSPALAAKEKRPVMNVVHASETQEEAAHEIKLWFPKTKIESYDRICDNI